MSALISKILIKVECVSLLSLYFEDTYKGRYKGRVCKFIEVSVRALRAYAFIPCFF